MRSDIKSFQIFAEQFDFIPSTTARYYVLAKGRPGGILEIVQITIHANGDDKIKDVFRVFSIRGVQARIDHKAEIDGGALHPFTNPVYLADGHEIGVRLTGEKFDSTCKVFVHYLWHPDEEK